MANDGTVKIGVEVDESGFKASLSRISKLAKSSSADISVDVDADFSNAEKDAENFQDALEDVSSELKKGEKATSNLNESTDDLGRSYTSVGDIIKGVAIGDLIASGVKTAVGAINDLLGELWNLDEATEEYRIAQGKLNTAFEAAGLSAEAAQESYSGFYKILGDVDTATEASQLLATLVRDEKDVSTWTNIAAGVFGTFGDSLPIEGLIEAANETAKTGQVTGVLADALNWAGISEDKFNERLEKCSSEADRNRLIMDTLSLTYDDAADAFYRNNEELIRAREVQAQLDETMASLGETVSLIKNELIAEFLPGIVDVVSAFNDLINGVEGADEAFSAAIGNLIEDLAEKLPEFLSFGVDIIQAILSGLIQSLPVLLDGIINIISEIGQALVELAPMLWDAGMEILTYLADGLEQGIPALLDKLPETIESILGFFEEHGPELMEVGG